MFGFPRYSQAGTDQRGNSSRFGSYRREGLRYESDTTDAEWFVMKPLLPEASALGRPRATDLREPHHERPRARFSCAEDGGGPAW
jgi:hypothetical protein